MPIIPKSRIDQIAFVFTLLCIHVIGGFYFVELVPSQYAQRTWMNPSYLGHILLGMYSYINIMICIWMIIVTDVTSGSVILPSVLKPKWFYCSTCICNAPPRSFHCEICDKCILKRDHHCIFLGTCIGHTNFRYFVLLLLYITLSCFYLTLLLVRYTLTAFGSLSFSYIFSITVPFLAWLFGVLHSPYVLPCFITGFNSIIFVAVISCFVYHCQNIYRGRTTYERRHKKHEYNLGWRRNLSESLGKNYHIGWIFPLIDSPLLGNGIDFMTEATYEAAKTM